MCVGPGGLLFIRCQAFGELRGLFVPPEEGKKVYVRTAEEFWRMSKAVKRQRDISITIKDVIKNLEDWLTMLQCKYDRPMTNSIGIWDVSITLRTPQTREFEPGAVPEATVDPQCCTRQTKTKQAVSEYSKVRRDSLTGEEARNEERSPDRERLEVLKAVTISRIQNGKNSSR